ncbi:hypothetical protein I3843_14G061500 [Carya illinoinensis]|uniref:Tetratricopeptide repeat-like superfamily protein n=1 Tax=Carya illinoinensis TaxID=32201 RepID=A0A922AJS5_CARIL|nr:hypothetical protein I3760_14G062300 [Carya illinoinensis]KAG2669975.1 hypothetical protein I3760_14G062300 [Carya illinoinensis]KAG6678083.1 hypothetical protein I3842_14G062900 [Carya illinoinensis]KAG6678084.1 hypothetical protein I3842_14G062900 [Carya illinoinensis]KAG7946802.1 hypothetical protein I3843_14G061500 [Carya illinoinensis]
MGAKVAPTCLHWSQPIVSHPPSSSQTLASVVSFPAGRRSHRGDGGTLVCHYVQRLYRSALFGASSTALFRSLSCEYPKPRIRILKKVCSASLDEFSDEEFSKQIQELALQFQLSGDDDDNTSTIAMDDSESQMVYDSRDVNRADSCSSFNRSVNFVQTQHQIPQGPNPSSELEPPWPEMQQGPPEWVRRDEIIPASIERKANSVDLPLSLRMIKRKMQWQEGYFREVGESAYCSVKKAFSSMVFIIRELQSYTLQMRELLFYEDVQGILARVQREMHTSFVWLFQQVFSHTPTLMVYVMILLANFSVYSMGHSNAAMAASVRLEPYAATTEMASVVEIDQDQKHERFDSSAIKKFSVSSSWGKTTSIDGNNGGGGKVRPVGSGTEGEGKFNGPDYHYRKILPDGASSQLSSSYDATREGETEEEEAALWNAIVEEASNIRSAILDEALDQETMQRFVSPVTAKIEADYDYGEYLRTELLYLTELAQEHGNPLVLANFAQFLYLVARDYDRAEEYFRKAVGTEPPDAEAHSKYANFLWKVKKDLWAAEERFLEAISADPSNPYHAANYANFLWNTGGEDTCFPLGPTDTTQDA